MKARKPWEVLVARKVATVENYESSPWEWAHETAENERQRLFVNRIKHPTAHGAPYFEDRPYPGLRREVLAWASLGKEHILEVEAIAREIFPRRSSHIVVVWGFLTSELSYGVLHRQHRALVSPSSAASRSSVTWSRPSRSTPISST